MENKITPMVTIENLKIYDAKPETRKLTTFKPTKPADISRPKNIHKVPAAPKGK